MVLGRKKRKQKLEKKNGPKTKISTDITKEIVRVEIVRKG